jgi:predicted nucleic acid-binding Zn ribbon protein
VTQPHDPDPTAAGIVPYGTVGAPGVPDAGAEQAPVPDAARAVLSRMRAAARSAPSTTTGAQRPGRRPARVRRRGGGGFSGPGPDARDPQPLESAWAELVQGSGWRRALDGAGVHTLWPQIVGPVNAEHATPESFDADTGALLVRTSSTAWAEQLRGMLPMLRSALDARLGPGVVRDIQVVGPAAPRTRGRLRVRGRGPRDTYG